MAEVLAVSSEAALDQLYRLPLTLPTGLRPTQVTATVRDLLVKLNVFRAIPPDGIQEIPHRPVCKGQVITCNCPYDEDNGPADRPQF